ncbi:MAG: cupin domain-containing protein [Hyphomicrobiaceae bacterium]|nr:cupin domain-containing protein [Hyphomicrobiaceae bacterium]
MSAASQPVAAPDLETEFARIREHWSPRVIASANGQYIKLAKVKGSFVWHSHADEDEAFLVHKGTLLIRYRDRPDVVLREGGFHVVPRGVEHITEAAEECWLILFEPAATRHTGDVVADITKSIDRQTAHLAAEPSSDQSTKADTA